MAAAILARDRGLTVLSATHRAERAVALDAVGVDHVAPGHGKSSRPPSPSFARSD
jgi:hypothetical protein